MVIKTKVKKKVKKKVYDIYSEDSFIEDDPHPNDDFTDDEIICDFIKDEKHRKPKKKRIKEPIYSEDEFVEDDPDFTDDEYILNIFKDDLNLTQSEEIKQLNLEYKDHQQIYSTVKLPLNSIVRNNTFLSIIQKAVFTINKIVIHGNNLFKAYCLHTYDKVGTLPDVTEDFANCVLQAVATCKSSGATKTGHNQIITDSLQHFLDNEYNEIFQEEFDTLIYTNLSQVILYEATSMVTNLSNHIMLHYEACFNKTINGLLHKEDHENTIEEEYIKIKLEERQKLHNIINIKKDTEIKNYQRFLNAELRAYTQYMYNNRVPDSNNKVLIKEQENAILYNDRFKKIKIAAKKDFTDRFTIINKELLTTKNDKIKKLRSNIMKLKKDILNNTDKCSNLFRFASIKKFARECILPKFVVEPTKRVLTSVEKDPLKFFESMLVMNRTLEKLNMKTFTVFPLRMSNIPKHIKIDTVTIASLTLPSNYKGIAKKEYTHDNVVKYRDDTWGYSFKTEKKVFNMYSKNKHKKIDFEQNLDDSYVFNNMISTDGVSCSILRVRKDKYNPNDKTTIPKMKKPYNYVAEEDMYISDLPQEQKDIYKTRIIYGMDPNKGNLFMGSTIKTKYNGDTYLKSIRYTQNQRRTEMKTNKYKAIKDHLCKTTYVDHLTGSGTIKEIEAMLSKCDFKSCNVKTVMKDLKTKTMVNMTVRNFYEHYLFRKLNLNSYINKQKSESKMINNFRKKCGRPEDVFLCFGNWGNSKQMKHLGPTMGKGLKRVFIKHHYKMALEDEYNSSGKSYPDGFKTEAFRMRGIKKPKKDSKEEYYKESPKTTDNKKRSYTYRLWYGLLRFPNAINNKTPLEILPGEKLRLTGKGISKEKHILINRDINASLNIRWKGICSLNNMPYPEHLSRT
jgi:hypothetical protein